MIHASWLEVVWAICAACGWTCSLLNFWTAMTDYHYKARKPNVLPLRLFMVRAVYEGSKVYLFVFSWMFGNSIWGLTHSPPPPPLIQMPQSLGNVISWLVIASALTFQQVRAIKWRRQITFGDYEGSGMMGRRASDARP